MSDSVDYLLMQMFVKQVEVTAENLKKLYGLKDKDIERILDRYLTADRSCAIMQLKNERKTQ